jgi:hypothetical protein
LDWANLFLRGSLGLRTDLTTNGIRAVRVHDGYRTPARVVKDLGKLRRFTSVRGHGRLPDSLLLGDLFRIERRLFSRCPLHLHRDDLARLQVLPVPRLDGLERERLVDLLPAVDAASRNSFRRSIVFTSDGLSVRTRPSASASRNFAMYSSMSATASSRDIATAEARVSTSFCLTRAYTLRDA